jgi:hypothetical protein
MQFLDEFLGERIALAVATPVLSARDIFPFGFVELAAKCDV